MAGNRASDGDRRNPDADDELVRSEEELRVGTTEQVVGTVRARKHVATERATARVARSSERGEFDRAPANENDSGQIESLEDGSVSIPLLEERLVVRKEVFVRERVVLHKHVVTAQHEITAELRKEEIQIEADEGADD